MIGQLSAIDWQLFGVILFGLAMFGLAYNSLVAWMGEHKEGYVSLLVVGGVIVTLIGTAIITPAGALVAAACFAASGLPMIIGDIVRHAIERQRYIEAAQKLAERYASQVTGDKDEPA